MTITKKIQKYFLSAYTDMPIAVYYKTKYLFVLDMVTLLVAPIIILIHFMLRSSPIYVLSDLFGFVLIAFSLLLIRKKKPELAGTFLIIAALSMAVSQNLVNDYLTTEPRHFLNMIESAAVFILILLGISVFSTKKHKPIVFALVMVGLFITHFFILRNRFYDGHASREMISYVLSYSVAILFSGSLSALIITMGDEFIAKLKKQAKNMSVVNTELKSALSAIWDKEKRIRQFNKELEQTVFERTRDLLVANDELENLNEITSQLIMSFDFDEVFEKIAELLITIYGFESCIYFEFDVNDKSITMIKMIGPEGYEEEWAKYIGKRQPLTKKILNARKNMQNEILFYQIDDNTKLDNIVLPEQNFIIKNKIKTLLTASIKVNDIILGDLLLTAHNETVVLSDHDITSIKRLINQTALVIRNTKLYSEIKYAREMLQQKTELMEYELDIAREMQMRFIPVQSPFANIAFYYKPMEQVGGDFFDVFALPDGKIGLFVSDVSGHGVPAAFVTSVIKSAILDYKTRFPNPAELLFYLNDRLYDMTNDKFVTAFYGIYEPSTRKLVFSNAAHNPPFVIIDNKISYLESKPGMALGFFSNSDVLSEGQPICYEDNVVVLEQGSKLLLYTDGLTETINIKALDEVSHDKIEYFEDKQLLKILSKSKKLPASDFVDTLVNRLIKFRGKDSFDDDVCIICIDVE